MYCNYQGTWKSGDAKFRSWWEMTQFCNINKFYCKLGNYVCLHTFRNLERLINFTTRHMCLQLSCFHEFMTYQGTWKSGDEIWKYICTAIIKAHANQVMQKILWEFSIFKVSELFTLLKSADCLHCQIQLIFYILKVSW